MNRAAREGGSGYMHTISWRGGSGARVDIGYTHTRSGIRPHRVESWVESMCSLGRSDVCLTPTAPNNAPICSRARTPGPRRLLVIPPTPATTADPPPLCDLDTTGLTVDHDRLYRP